MTNRWPAWWLVTLLVVMAFAFQGTRAIFEPDEGRYTAGGINMLESGDWLVPTLDGERPHLTKPPIVYWAIAASIGAFGYNEWAARLPGALAFVGTGLLLFGLGRRFCPSQPSLPAVAWTLSMPPLAGANVASTDALLMFFEAAAMYAFVEAWCRDGTDRRRWLLGMWCCWGLAFMTKGPPGLLPLLAMAVFLALHDRARLRGVFAPAGLALFAVVGLTWFVLVVRRLPDSLGYFLGYEVYDRLFTAAHDRNAQWYGAFEVYLPMLLAGALPWTALALKAAGGPAAAWRRLRQRIRERDRETLLLLYWFLVPLAVFFLARSRLQLYVLPLFVPLALISGRALAAWTWLDGRRLRLIAGTTAVALLALKGTAAYLPTDRDARRMAAEIRDAVDLEGLDGIAFIDTRALFGLTLYLDLRVESVHVGGPVRRYSRLLQTEDLCGELAEREYDLYALKRDRMRPFLDAVAVCGRYRTWQVGSFHGDGKEYALFRIEPAADTPAG